MSKTAGILCAPCLFYCQLYHKLSNTFFVTISAYEVLSDEDKRKQYDRLGESAFKHEGQDHRDDFHFNFNEFFQGWDSAFDAHKQGHKFSGGNGFNSGFQFDFGGLFDEEFENMFDDNDMFEQFSFFDSDDDAPFEFDFGDSMFNNLHFADFDADPSEKYRREKNDPDTRHRSHGGHASFSASSSNRGI